jgi:predicted O-methyltransferase YrrM
MPGHGRIISLDHDEVFAEKTRHTLRLHDLSDLVQVVYAPLVPTSVGNATWQW